MRERQQPPDHELGHRHLPEPGQYTRASIPSRAPTWKFSSAAENDICDHTGRSSSAITRTSP